MQADPYLNGIVVPEQDKVCESPSRLSLKVTELKEALYSLNSLEIKLKVSLYLFMGLPLSSFLFFNE